MKTYQLVEGQKSGELGIQFLTTEFEGMVVHIGKVAINPSDDGEEANLAFDYTLVRGVLPDDTTNLEEAIGDAIVDVLVNNIELTEFPSGDS